MSNTYDAILIVSFGGPEGVAEVMPFLRNVTRGRNVPEERLVQVAHHYDMFDGVSPLNQQNRNMISALEMELSSHGPQLPLYWGNRNWQPYLKDTLEQMQKDGVKRALAFVTSAYSSYSSCRQYLDDIKRAQEELGDGAPTIDKIRPFYNHPLFIEANIEHLRDAISAAASLEVSAQDAQQDLQKEAAQPPNDLHIAFTAHSIPLTMAQGCQYSAQLEEASRLIAERCKVKNWNLVYQSRSGAPSIPWLEPDILDHIRNLSDDGVRNLIIQPLGFVSDHMEVVYDLDVEAKALCAELGIKMQRAKTAGTNAKFIQMIRQLILERCKPCDQRPFVGTLGALPDLCSPECCPLGMARSAASMPGQEHFRNRS